MRVCNRGQRSPENSSPPETTMGERQPGTAIPSQWLHRPLDRAQVVCAAARCCREPVLSLKAQNKHCISLPRGKSTFTAGVPHLLGVGCWCVNTKLTLPLLLQLMSPSSVLGLPAGVPAACPELPAPPWTASAPSAHTFILSLRPRLVRARLRDHQPHPSLLWRRGILSKLSLQPPTLLSAAVVRAPHVVCLQHTPKFLRYQPM